MNSGDFIAYGSFFLHELGIVVCGSVVSSCNCLFFRKSAINTQHDIFLLESSGLSLDHTRQVTVYLITVQQLADEFLNYSIVLDNALWPCV